MDDVCLWPRAGSKPPSPPPGTGAALQCPAVDTLPPTAGDVTTCGPRATIKLRLCSGAVVRTSPSGPSMASATVGTVASPSDETGAKTALAWLPPAVNVSMQFGPGPGQIGQVPPSSVLVELDPMSSNALAPQLQSGRKVGAQVQYDPGAFAGVSARGQVVRVSAETLGRQWASTTPGLRLDRFVPSYAASEESWTALDAANAAMGDREAAARRPPSGLAALQAADATAEGGLGGVCVEVALRLTVVARHGH